LFGWASSLFVSLHILYVNVTIQLLEMEKKIVLRFSLHNRLSDSHSQCVESAGSNCLHEQFLRRLQAAIREAKQTAHFEQAHDWSYPKWT